MLEMIGGAAGRRCACCSPLSVVQLCLWVLRVRHAQLLLAVWTAVPTASPAMPALERSIRRHLSLLAAMAAKPQHASLLGGRYQRGAKM